MKTWEDEYINKGLVATNWHISNMLIIMHLEIVIDWKWGISNIRKWHSSDMLIIMHLEMVECKWGISNIMNVNLTGCHTHIQIEIFSSYSVVKLNLF
jgi:hypothetical protein